MRVFLFILCARHNKPIRKHLIHICLKLAVGRNDINILLYFNAECRYFGTKVYINCWILTNFDIDTFPPSFLFTLVNNNNSIVNTHFFSRHHLIRRKVLVSALIFTN